MPRLRCIHPPVPSGEIEGKTEGAMEGNIKGNIEGTIDDDIDIEGNIEGEIEGKIEIEDEIEIDMDIEGNIDDEIEIEGNIKGDIEGKIESEGSCLWVGTIGLVAVHYMFEVEVDAMEYTWVSKYVGYPFLNQHPCLGIHRRGVGDDLDIVLGLRA